MSDTIDVERLTKIYLKMRDARAKLSKEYRAADKAIEEQQDLVANNLLEFLNETKQKSARTSYGNVIKTLEVIPICDDWPTLYKWIADNMAFGFLHKRITAKEVAAYAEANEGELPPGVRAMKQYKIVVRKDGEKED